MGLGVKALEKFATSGIGSKLYKWASSEKGQKWLYESLPTLETVVATSCYVVATERQDLSRREKNILQWQNVLPALVGMAAGTYLNRKVFKFGEKVIEKLKPELVPDAHKIMGGIRVALPLVTTAILMRWALPVATAFLSGEIEEYKSKKNKKLDVKA
jgi:uncharacterized membrane protein